MLTDFEEQEPQLILLDINLPVLMATIGVKNPRSFKVPIIFISSRNTNMDMIMAMNMGADDFVTKPLRSTF